MSLQLPLSGYRVVDFSRYGPGPYCTMLLGDLGADVVVIDDGTPPSDRGRRSGTGSTEPLTRPLDFMRRNARRIALDLRHPDGQAVIARLVERADVVIESFRPGVAARLGVGAAELRARRPELVHCSISGYGQAGPYREWQGHDINYLALGGLLDQTGPAGADPVLPGTLVADLAAGGLPAAVAILAALLRRDRTGEGASIDTSLQEGVSALMAPTLALALAGWPAGRGASVLTGGAPWYRVYRAADGRHIAVGAIEPWLFAELCARLRRPDWVARQFDTDAWPEIARDLEALFATRSRDDWMAELGPAGVCVTAVLDLNETLDDPQLASRPGPRAIVAGDPVALDIPALPVVDGLPRGARRRPSNPGADAREILAELDFMEDEREQLLTGPGVALP